MKDKTHRIRSNRPATWLACVPALLLTVAAISQDVKLPIRQALDAGDTTLAIDLINKDIAVDPAYNVNYYTLGRIHYQRGQYEQARQQFEIALEKKKKDYESQYFLGLCYLHLGDLVNAEKTMEDGRKKSKDGRAMFEDGFGLVMMAKKDYQAADKAFRQALVIDEKNALFHIHLGDANLASGVPSLAAGEYQKALETDTGSTEVYFHWAEACLEMKDYSCAIEKLRIVLTKDSTHAPAWMRAGGIYFKAALSTTNREERANRFKETIGSYKRYLELSHAKSDSSTVRAYFETAMAYSNLGGYEEAANYFQQVLSIPYEPRDIYFNYGKALWGLKKFDEAAQTLLKHLDWVAKQGPEYTPTISTGEVYQLLGDCYYYREARDYVNAVTYYKKSLEFDSTQKRVLENLAVSYHSLKSFAQALTYYDKRIELGIDSSRCNIYKNAGFCALNLAGNTNVDDEMNIDGATGSDTVAAVSSNGLDPNKNYYEVAVEYLQKYLVCMPNDVKALSLAGTTYLFQLKDCANGSKMFEKVLTVEPNNCEAKRSLGFAYFGGLCQKNYSRALDFLLAAHDCTVKAKGACGDVDLILWIAQTYHSRAADRAASDKAGSKADFKAANEWYGKVLKCQPGNAVAKKGQNDTQFEF
ncbi:MAG: tetratricopeptide repeat protein [Candidatus Zixiibacteriota bacterium]